MGPPTDDRLRADCLTKTGKLRWNMVLQHALLRCYFARLAARTKDSTYLPSDLSVPKPAESYIQHPDKPPHATVPYPILYDLHTSPYLSEDPKMLWYSEGRIRGQAEIVAGFLRAGLAGRNHYGPNDLDLTRAYRGHWQAALREIDAAGIQLDGEEVPAQLAGTDLILAGPVLAHYRMNRLTGLFYRIQLFDTEFAADRESPPIYTCYAYVPPPPRSVQVDYIRWDELYNLVKERQWLVAADRLCELGPEGEAYSVHWRMDTEIAAAAGRWLGLTYDHQSPEGKAAAEVAAGAARFLAAASNWTSPIPGAAFDCTVIDDGEPAGYDESRPHLG